MSLVDADRPVKASQGFAGSTTRRIDVTVWRPATAAALLPLLVYSHGTFDSADNALHIVHDLVAQGYAVAAPDYPLTSCAAYTRIEGPDLSDVANQTRDIGFIIDGLLADPSLAIDAGKIGTFGHSLGGVTSYFASFGAQTRDPRISATALLGAGDPVQAALFGDMGLAGVAQAEAPIPVLFLSAQHDVFAALIAPPYAAYSRVGAPKYEVMIEGGTHVWFRDGDEPSVDGRNPDCGFFDRAMPGAQIPGCTERVALTTADHQRKVVRYAIRAFFDAYLKGEGAARGRLEGIATVFEGVTLRSEG